MLKLFGEYIHWIVLILVAVSLAVSFFVGQYETSSMIFGVIGLLAVVYLVYRVEWDKRKKKNDSKTAP